MEAKHYPHAFITVVLLLLAGTSVAQPEYFGCHYFKRKAHRHTPVTEADRMLINESILRSDTFDIIHYAIHLDVTDYANEYIKGVTTVSYSPLMPDLGSIRFDLFGLQVDSVIGESGSLAFTYDNELLRVQFDEVPAVGSVQQLTVHYQGNPHRDPYWGGFYFESYYIYNLGIGLTTVPPNFGKVWYPCFDSFVERATYEYHVKSAGGMRAVCQGELMGEVELGGDTLLRSYMFDQPIPTHISAIAAADYALHEYMFIGEYGEVPVTLAAKPANLNAMVNKFAHLGDAIDACQYWYGPQPFDRVGYVLTTDGALEIPTNIAFPEFMTAESESSNRSLYSHELGHHWWGDHLVMRHHTDMWMKEGPAEYSSHLVTEWMEGQEAFVEKVKRNQLYVLEEAHIADEGFHPLSGIPEEWIYGVHTYNKGAAVMHNLRGYLGDELFRQALSGVQAHNAWQDLTAEELKLALEQETGYDLDPFFNAWIYQPGFSVFVIDSLTASPVEGANEVTLFVQQQLRMANEFHDQVPLDLTLIGPGWERQEYLITADGEFSEITVTAPFSPVMAVLNGHNRLNQGRMDFEHVIYPGESFSSSIPYVDFRVYDEAIVDSTLLRVEHIWAAPDNENLGEGIFEISSSHYWNVDGIWPEGTVFEGRAYYSGSEDTDLDSDLAGSTEADLVMVYRATPAEPWQVYPDFTISAGNLDNGTGHIHLDVLRKGQYSFANGNPAVSVNEPGDAGAQGFRAFPSPASGFITAEGITASEDIVLLDLFDADGHMVKRCSVGSDGNFSRRMDLSELSSGNYILQAHTSGGDLLGSVHLPVIR